MKWFKKSTCILISVILISSFFYSCKTNETENIQKNNESSNNTKKSEVSDNSSENDIINIFFIGNSLTYTGTIPVKVASMATLKGIKADVKQSTKPSYSLLQHLSELEGAEFNDVREKTDILILQEYGTNMDLTVKATRGIIRLFKRDVKVYFLLTEFDIELNREEELSQFANLDFIHTGEIHNKLINNGLKYSQLHFENDYHPNGLYGYASALAVYSTIFDKSCLNMKYDFLTYDEIDLIPGKTKGEKNRIIEKIQRVVFNEVNKEK